VEFVIVAVAVVAGLVVLYTVIRLAVRDGVLDARAKDDAGLAERNLDATLRKSRTKLHSVEELDDRAE
jgi:hypothetical protein